MLALAAAEPEAKPFWAYGGYAAGYPLAYSGYAASPIAYSGYAAGYAAYNPYVTRVFKREAEAEAEAKPFYPYAAYTAGYPFAYSGYAASPLAYSGYAAGYAGYAAYNPYVARVFKREAEAEAEPEPFYPYAAYGAGYPFAYSAYSAYAPYAAYAAASPAVPAIPGAYAAAGRYVANSAGVVHIAKREAEAEAKPFYPFAATYAASPLAYNAYSYGAYAASPLAYSGVYSPYRYFL